MYYLNEIYYHNHITGVDHVTMFRSQIQHRGAPLRGKSASFGTDHFGSALTATDAQLVMAQSDQLHGWCPPNRGKSVVMAPLTSLPLADCNLYGVQHLPLRLPASPSAITAQLP